MTRNVMSVKEEFCTNGWLVDLTKGYACLMGEKVQFLYFLNPKCPVSSHLLWLYSSVCVRPVQKPHCWFSRVTAQINSPSSPSKGDITLVIRTLPAAWKISAKKI